METENVKTRLTPNGILAITQFFGAGHQGLDWTGYNGWHIICDELCHSDGIVEMVGYEEGGYGNFVKIKHNDTYSTLYAHIANGGIYVKEGQKIYRGEKVGLMGNTGLSFGSHCHWECFKNGVKIDPLPYINADFPEVKPSAEGFHTGDLVNVKPYAKVYGTSLCYAEWIYEKPMTVYEEPCGDRVVISYDGIVQGACYDHDLVKVQPSGSFKEGDKVKIKTFIDYNGTHLAEWLDSIDLTILELNGDRAVLVDAKGTVQCAISTKNIEVA